MNEDYQRADKLEPLWFYAKEGYLKHETLTIPLAGIDRNVYMSFSQVRRSIYGI